VTEPRILFIAANPSVDRSYQLDRLVLGAIHRPRRVVAVAGGKGLNAARAAARLGGPVSVIGIVRGAAGDWIEARVAKAGIEADWVRGDGETRTCVSVNDATSGQMTEIYESGDALAADTWLRFEERVREHLDTAGVSVMALAGSLPVGAPVDGYARLAQVASRRAVALLVDSHGAPLSAVLSQPVRAVKVNADEAAEVTGLAVATPAEAFTAGRAIRARGPDYAVVTLGALGAVLISDRGATHLRLPPNLAGPYSVGSGDVFLGAFVMALGQQATVEQATRLGVGAATANTLVLGTGEFDPETARHFAEAVQASALTG
jgi:1-phosphofructokinase family hexose kinase